MASKRHRKLLRMEAQLNDRIKNLEDEARGIARWLNLYGDRANHDDIEDVGWALHDARHESIIHEIRRLKSLKASLWRGV